MQVVNGMLLKLAECLAHCENKTSHQVTGGFVYNIIAVDSANDGLKSLTRDAGTCFPQEARMEIANDLFHV